jgi:hypothetical protein
VAPILLSAADKLILPALLIALLAEVGEATEDQLLDIMFFLLAVFRLQTHQVSLNPLSCS